MQESLQFCEKRYFGSKIFEASKREWYKDENSKLNLHALKLKLEQKTVAVHCTNDMLLLSMKKLFGFSLQCLC
ncbi:unnamed protein product [Cuscuta campestris]|uniref:Uncharacterized protein n=1 Tax=Cuscuta campestris TaxID=132261 RepID=A0A484KD28_9ASTE|nr:unnamed protein product [Cuscuta campestris]